jgi:uncharacterized membrane protein
MAEVERATEVRTDDGYDDDRSVRRETVRSGTVTDSRILARRVIWYIAGVIIVLLALRFLLFMLGANRDSGFVDFIYSVSAIFAAPFSGIFPAPTYGQFFFDTASLVAMLVYALIAWGLARLFTLNTSRADVV